MIISLYVKYHNLFIGDPFSFGKKILANFIISSGFFGKDISVRVIIHVFYLTLCLLWALCKYTHLMFIVNQTISLHTVQVMSTFTRMKDSVKRLLTCSVHWKYFLQTHLRQITKSMLHHPHSSQPLRQFTLLEMKNMRWDEIPCY